MSPLRAPFARLRTVALAGAVAGALAALSCAGASRPVDPDVISLGTAPDAAPAPPPEPLRTCRTNADCAAGEDCAGEEGCEVAWTCQPARPCTRDAVPYCTCDGRTVTGSSRCPPEPYRARGACPGPALP